MRKLYSNSGLILLAVILLVFSASDVHAQGRGRSRLMTFEGTLLKYSPWKFDCGRAFTHQVAKYRVDRVLSGKYDGDEIVVDHPACNGNVFKNVPVGSRVRITVRVLRTYPVHIYHPGIRDWNHPGIIEEEGQTPKIWYVAGGPHFSFAPPKKIE
jgi:hypothetical protein